MDTTQGELFDEPQDEAAFQNVLERLEAMTPLAPNAWNYDRNDPVWKMWREFDRLRGLLRFKAEGPENRYTARCAPDHFVLPLLADHFLERFGETAWAIIDEKRKLVLIRDLGQEPELRRWTPHKAENGGTGMEKWEELWKNYHRSINNKDRANPALQKQFMPRRYWKYLTEMQ